MVKMSLVAAPGVMVALALTALVSPLEAAVRVQVPVLLMLQPANVATPERALTGSWYRSGWPRLQR